MFQTKRIALLALNLCIAAIYGNEHDDPRCMQWAEAGECDANPNYMWEYCRYQCEQVQSHEKHSLKGIVDFFDLSARDINGKELSFEQFRGHFTIVTNVASFCGYTESHYSQLVELYSKLKPSGRVYILAFPCNQFGNQEPGSNSEIDYFAKSKGVEFIMMDKIDVNGMDEHVVYTYLKKITRTPAIRWNFNTYFVIDPFGKVESHTDIEPLQLFEPIKNRIDEL
mmetsp:Transcript_8154/g.10464  ORF Transcript_8154/g.10464 Transcript_8154/m.10464 type:complete len:225 (-) Transcript_8154:268-942(-)